MAGFRPIGAPEPVDTEAPARVREWALELFADSEAPVVVSELACSEPGCPPLETVIAVLEPGAPRKVTIEKPLAEVTRDDVRTAFASQGG